MAIRRADAARLVRERLRASDIVVCSLGSTGRAWREAAAPNLTYWASDPMGTAPALALGLALALPRRRVVLLEGDGDLAMNLGVLLAIAGAAPANLRLAVFVNGRYETGGGQPLPGGEGRSFAAIARGAGFARASEARDAAAAASALDALLGDEGLGLVALHIEAEPSPYPADPGPTSQAEDRAAFQRRLAEGS